MSYSYHLIRVNCSHFVASFMPSVSFSSAKVVSWANGVTDSPFAQGWQEGWPQSGSLILLRSRATFLCLSVHSELVRSMFLYAFAARDFLVSIVSVWPPCITSSCNPRVYCTYHLHLLVSNRCILTATPPSASSKHKVQSLTWRRMAWIISSYQWRM